MARYKNTSIKKRNKKNYYETTIYKKVEEKNNDMYFIAQEGDRCDNLANRFYGDSTLWWFIARVNNLSTNNIPAGTSLRIPTSTQDAEGF
jgi:nucleoid-associated protein YgaU|tara:strand:+ start:197 stop:466 length:270 start_codon:yes stop_codon:yes gene_type:complete